MASENDSVNTATLRALLLLGVLQVLGTLSYFAFARGWPALSEALALACANGSPFVCAFALKLKAPRQYVSSAAALIAFGCALKLNFVTGGLASPFITLFLTLPSGAFSSFGARGVLGLALLAASGYGLVFLGHTMGWIHPLPIDDALLNRARFILLVYCVAVFTIVGVGVEKTRAISTRALARQRDRAAAANRAKSDFLAMMSHELRTPLAGLTGALSLAVDETQETLVRERLAMALSSAASLRTLLDDVLDFSRIEAGRMQMNAEPVAPSRVVHEVVALFTPAARLRGSEMVEDVDAGMALGVSVDGLRFRQVLSNLVGNAIKFTEKGRVTVRARTKDQGEKREIEIEVIDTGVGMTAEQLSKLFEPFVQVHERGGGGGSGLGLVISRALITQMGGTLELESKKGEGTRAIIRVSLPVSELPPEVVAPSKLPVRAPAERLRVMVAEDTPILRRVIEAMLRYEGCDVIFANDGEEAIRLADEERFDLIFMDVHMPVLDGLSATRVIRKGAGRAARLPIIGLSAGAFAENERTALEAGMDGYLVKPVNREDLAAVVQRVRASLVKSS
jgi:signal transduction histidine kinase/CheY-like chemotaxis protein